MKNNNITIAHQSNQNIERRLINNKDKIPALGKSGIYEIKCCNCDKSYIGQSGRAIRKRFSEHLTHPNSAVYQHIIEEGHNFNITNMKLLKHLPKSILMDYTEMFYIHKRRERDKNALINNIVEFPGDHLFTYRLQ